MISSLIWPLSTDGIVTQRDHGRRLAWDVVAPAGTMIVSPMKAIVQKATWEDRCGWTIVLYDRWHRIVLCHAKSLSGLTPSYHTQAGEALTEIGRSGNVKTREPTTMLLHFSVERREDPYKGWEPISPSSIAWIMPGQSLPTAPPPAPAADPLPTAPPVLAGVPDSAAPWALLLVGGLIARKLFR